LDRIINELLQERNRVQAIIEALERKTERAGSAARSELTARARKRRDERRGRKSMGPAERQQVSLRMKHYWAAQRQQRAAAASA
jgi:hypothetical protein